MFFLSLGLLILFEYVSDSLLGEGEVDAQLLLENSSKRGLQLIHVSYLYTNLRHGASLTSYLTSLQALSSVFPAIFFGREIFTDYLLPFLWKSVNNPVISEIVLQILTNVGGAQGSYQQNSAGSDQNSTILHSIPWWAADDEVIPNLIDKFILKGIILFIVCFNTNFLCRSLDH